MVHLYRKVTFGPSRKARRVPHAAREMIQRFHERYTGSTFRAFSRLLDIDQRNSYEILLEAGLDGIDATTILDLGCGDGAMLEVIAARKPGAALFGIDFSKSEVETARRRLPNATITIGDLLEPLPFADRQFDVVFSHLVLMLLGNLDALLSEVSRVLRPGGRFAFVVDGTERSGSHRGYFDAVRTVLTSLDMTVPESFSRSADRRLYDPAGFDAALTPHGLKLAAHTDFSTAVPRDEEFVVALILQSYPLTMLDDDATVRATEVIRAWYREWNEPFHLSNQLYVIERAS